MRWIGMLGVWHEAVSAPPGLVAPRLQGLLRWLLALGCGKSGRWAWARAGVSLAALHPPISRPLRQLAQP
jgi:hypothetical protein